MLQIQKYINYTFIFSEYNFFARVMLTEVSNTFYILTNKLIRKIYSKFRLTFFKLMFFTYYRKIYLKEN